MAFWNRFPYSNFHEINLDWIIREMKKISGSVSDFARQWEKALKQETGERQEADRQLQENIDAETNRAEAAEDALDQKIEAETNRATEAEKALDRKIDAETARATEKENDLQEQITAEVNRATVAESNLQQQITSNDTDIAALQKGLQDETTARTEADETLDQKITAETSRATAREDELEDMITTETERATAKENELDQKITTETQRATAAEGALGDRIDGLEGELDGVTGADSPFIRKDGTTTTTGKIPLAQGGTSEVDPAAATDLVNLRSMQAADQALESSMTEYVDNQLEAAVADVHSIPAGGTTGQVLGKASDADYAVQWVDQSGGGFTHWTETGSDEGTSILKSTNPNPLEISVDSNGVIISHRNNTITMLGPRTTFDSVIETDEIRYRSSQLQVGFTDHAHATFDLEGLKIDDGSTTPTAGQVLTATDNVGTVKWQDAPSGSDPDAIKKDGTTVTTARIPFAEGINTDSVQSSSGTLSVRSTALWLNGTTSLRVNAGNDYGTSGQVLTAQGDGTCRWEDAAGGYSVVTDSEYSTVYKTPLGNGYFYILVTKKEIEIETGTITTIATLPEEANPKYIVYLTTYTRYDGGVEVTPSVDFFADDNRAGLSAGSEDATHRKMTLPTGAIVTWYK